MRRFTATASAGICVLAAACSVNNPFAPATSSSSPPPVVAVSDLDGLLLSVEQINTAMHATGMTVAKSNTDLSDDSPDISPKNCLPVYSNTEDAAYSGSGYTAVREQVLHQPGDVGQSTVTEVADQAVVAFPAATDAAKFFTASTTQWQSCANRQFQDTKGGTSDTWTVGAVSNTNNTLSVTKTQEDANGWHCQRGLTVRNNVAVDIETCSYSQGDFGVDIANQIAAKIPTK